MFAHEIPRNYSAEYKCYSVSMMPGQERQDVEQGGKSMYVFSLLMQSHNRKDLGGVFFCKYLLQINSVFVITLIVILRNTTSSS